MPNHPITPLDSAQINGDQLTIELVEADETPAVYGDEVAYTKAASPRFVVIIRWPSKPSVLHPRRFPEVAAMVARTFASASTELSRIKARKRL